MVAAVYILCPDCTHTTNIHKEDGCHAYKCKCKKGF